MAVLWMSGSGSRVDGRRSIARTALTVLLAGAVPAWPAQAQTEACAAPCVRLVRVAELSTAVAPIVPSLVQSVLRMSDGRVLISHTTIPDPQIVVYDSAGAFVRLYDAVGGGPGELGRPPTLLPAPDGGVWALDQNRLIHFDARLRHLETADLRSQFGVSRLFPLSETSFLLTGRISPGDTFTVWIVNARESWNERRTVLRASDPYSAPLATPAVSGGFWTITPNALMLRRYAADGTPRDSVALDIPYFEPWSGPHEGEGVEGWNLPPRPRHMDVHDAGANRVVVVTRFTEDDWEPTPTNQMINFSERDENIRYDTALALVDASTGRMIATVRSDEYLRHVNGTPGYVFSTRADADGHVITKVYRIEVR